MVVLCIAIIADESSSEKDKSAHGKKRLLECGKKMKIIEPFLYACPLAHKRYYPFYKHDQKSKMKGLTKEGLEGFY